MRLDGRYQQRSGETYHVRRYQPRDRDRFLSLYESVWGRQKGGDWFEWRFEANPYREGVQMVVAEQGEQLVGAEPLLPFRLRIGETVHDTYQPVDWIVHPDHRRCGLFTRMTEAVLDQYLPDVSLLFNFPNELLLPGLRNFDWQTVSPVACRYRIQNTQAFIDEAKTTQYPTATSLVTTLGTPVVRAGLGVLDRLPTAAADIRVERSAGVAVETIQDLYQSARPSQIHVPRDRPFLQWRFDNPNWETTSYVARHDGEPVASIITVTDTTADCRLTYLVDIQPMNGHEPRSAAVDALLSAVVEDASESALIRAPSGYYPAVFRRHGFYRDDSFPLSVASTATTHAIRTASRDWTVQDERDESPTAPSASEAALADPAAWRLTLADIDIE